MWPYEVAFIDEGYDDDLKALQAMLEHLDAVDKALHCADASTFIMMEQKVRSSGGCKDYPAVTGSPPPLPCSPVALPPPPSRHPFRAPRPRTSDNIEQSSLLCAARLTIDIACSLPLRLKSSWTPGEGPMDLKHPEALNEAAVTRVEANTLAKSKTRLAVQGRLICLALSSARSSFHTSS